MNFSEYQPDGFVLLRILGESGDTLYKVFGSWSGSYLTGESWRVNSGIVKYELEDDFVVFYGDSGSKYACRVDSEGHLAAYNRNIVQNWVDKHEGLIQYISFEDFIKEFKV